MLKNLSNRQLLREYREVYSEYRSESAFDNFCANTLTSLLFFEQELTVINTFHNGKNQGANDVVLIAFFMGQKDKPLSIKKDFKANVIKN
jgi:hypothetical protein